MADACPRLASAAEAVFRCKDGGERNTGGSLQQVGKVGSIGEARRFGDEADPLTRETRKPTGEEDLGTDDDGSRRHVCHGWHAAQPSNHGQRKPQPQRPLAPDQSRHNGRPLPGVERVGKGSARPAKAAMPATTT